MTVFVWSFLLAFASLRFSHSTWPPRFVVRISRFGMGYSSWYVSHVLLFISRAVICFHVPSFVSRIAIYFTCWHRSHFFVWIYLLAPIMLFGTAFASQYGFHLVVWIPLYGPVRDTTIEERLGK